MKITYENEVLNFHHGQTDCEAGIYVDGEIVGIVTYVLYDKELTVSHIFVRPEFRRKGYGSRLIKYIKEINPEYTYKPSLKTLDGVVFKHKDLPLDEAIKHLSPKTSEEINKLNKNYLNSISSNVRNSFKKITKFLDKNKIEYYITPLEYYITNEKRSGIMIKIKDFPTICIYDKSDISSGTYIRISTDPDYYQFSNEEDFFKFLKERLSLKEYHFTSYDNWINEAIKHMPGRSVEELRIRLNQYKKDLSKISAKMDKYGERDFRYNLLGEIYNKIREKYHELYWHIRQLEKKTTNESIKHMPGHSTEDIWNKLPEAEKSMFKEIEKYLESKNISYSYKYDHEAFLTFYTQHDILFMCSYKYLQNYFTLYIYQEHLGRNGPRQLIDSEKFKTLDKFKEIVNEWLANG